MGDEAIATIIERFKHGSKPMGDYVKKKPKKQLAMALFDNDDFDEDEIEMEDDNDIAYDFFVVHLLHPMHLKKFQQKLCKWL